MCKKGQWLNSATNNCIDCMPGYQCPSSIDDSQNEACSPGFYSSKSNSMTCSPCRKGTKCMEDGLTSWEDCPVGFNCLDPGAIFVCLNGTYAASNGMKCNDCEKGSFCQNGIKSKCPRGSAAQQNGLTECQKCPEGVGWGSRNEF